jgi:CheY-like chemotaxis protein/HPt (histidine-containing phosphotransfer) domain-containing protein
MTLGSSAIVTRRLLIVGDPALSRGLMKMVLSRLGYVVTCVVTGQEALMALSHSSFALGLIALHLPDLPGLTLARRLREAPAPVGAMPIIMFGDAWDPARILESCREAGLAGYLPKPISIARLVSSIRDHVHRPQGEAGAPHVMPQPASFEIDRLNSFTAGDPQLERELISLYLATAGVYLDEMRGALGGGGGWAKAAHALKGASGNIGAAAVASLAGDAETCGPSPDRLAKLAAALDEVRAFLRQRTAATLRPTPIRLVG